MCFFPNLGRLLGKNLGEGDNKTTAFEEFCKYIPVYSNLVKEEKPMTDSIVDPQEYLDFLLSELELGHPSRWSQEEAHQFYRNFCGSKLLGGRVILEIIDVKEYQNFDLLIATVINPSTFTPFILPFNKNKWTLPLKVIKGKHKCGDVLTAMAEELKINEIQNESRKLSLLSIHVSSIQYCDLETVFSVKFGEVIVEKIVKQFGSLHKIAPLIVSQIEQEIKDEILKMEAELNKRKNELYAQLKEEEEKWREEHEKELKSLKEELSKIEREKKKTKGVKKLIDDEQKLLNEKQLEIEKQSKHLDEEAKKLEDYKQNLQSQFEKFRLIHPLLSGERARVEYEGKQIRWGDQKDIVATIRGALHGRCCLQYEQDTIESFIGALQTNQLIILHGPSGTGKSSLVRSFAEIIVGAKTYTVRVQSSWTDKQDILGFFNPIDYQYVSTEFLDALVEAKQNPDILYLICLDEMNLSHVEYYFAEFLSAREEKNPKISLYSKRFQQLAEEIIRSYTTVDERGLIRLDETKCQHIQNDSERLRLQNCFDLCYRYPAEFDIPKNVRFIGTMNMDHTVKGISPKVIDRSFVIELNHPEKEEVLLEELEKIKVLEQISVDVEKDLFVLTKDEAFRKKFEKLNPLLIKLGARLNYRSLDQISYYGRAVNSERAFDQVFRCKVLPRIQVLKNEKTKETMTQLLEQPHISERTKNKIKQMMERDRLITYWM